MNKKLDNIVIAVSLITLIGVITIISACTTTSTITNRPDGTFQTNVVKTLDLNRVTNAINAAVPPVVRIAVNHFPQSRQWVQDACTGIDTLLANGNYDPEAVNAALSTSGAGIVEQEDVKAAIDIVVGLYRTYYGDVLSQKLDKAFYLGTILKTLSVAIDKGLETPPL